MSRLSKHPCHDLRNRWHAQVLPVPLQSMRILAPAESCPSYIHANRKDKKKKKSLASEKALRVRMRASHSEFKAANNYHALVSEKRRLSVPTQSGSIGTIYSTVLTEYMCVQYFPYSIATKDTLVQHRLTCGVHTHTSYTHLHTVRYLSALPCAAAEQRNAKQSKAKAQQGKHDVTN